MNITDMLRWLSFPVTQNPPCWSGWDCWELEQTRLKGEIAKKMVTPSGFEPKLTGPKPVVLPLHHGVARYGNVTNHTFHNIIPEKDFFHKKRKNFSRKID